MTEQLARYRSVERAAEIEWEEKKSRFIGLCRPLDDADDAEAFVRECRERWPDATHHVYAWVLTLGQRLQRYSDDGEPQGTAGMPVLDVLRKNAIDQAGIVVVRYFGGIKLGGGGLVRAYGHSASLALEAARPITWTMYRLFRVTASYADAERVRYQLDVEGYTQYEPEYTASVAWDVAVTPAAEELFAQRVRDLTSDRADLRRGGKKYLPET